MEWANGRAVKLDVLGDSSPLDVNCHHKLAMSPTLLLRKYSVLVDRQGPCGAHLADVVRALLPGFQPLQLPGTTRIAIQGPFAMAAALTDAAVEYDAATV